ARPIKDQMSLTLRYTQAPPQPDMDGKSVTVEYLPKEGELECQCKLGSGTRAWRLQRRKAVPADLDGTWEGLAREGGLVETWTFRTDKGRWSMAGRWYKDGQEVGVFHGETVAVNRDFLQFTVKADKLPYDGFAGNNVRYSALQADGDVLSYEYAGGD